MIRIFSVHLFSALYVQLLKKKENGKNNLSHADLYVGHIFVCI